MRLMIKHTVVALLVSMAFWSCTKASGQGSLTLVVSGNVHGQLDPCG